MKVLPYLSSSLIKHSLGAYLGEGADGEVYALQYEPNKVIKYSIIFDIEYSYTTLDKYQQLAKKHQLIQQKKYSCFSKLYQTEMLLCYQRLTEVGLQEYLIFSAIMEKLFHLSNDEEKVFHTLVTSHLLNVRNKEADLRIAQILRQLSQGLDFSQERLTLFLQQLRDCPIRHTDLEPRNIMKDASGNFKLIDFDRLTYSH